MNTLIATLTALIALFHVALSLRTTNLRAISTSTRSNINTLLVRRRSYLRSALHLLDLVAATLITLITLVTSVITRNTTRRSILMRRRSTLSPVAVPSLALSATRASPTRASNTSTRITTTIATHTLAPVHSLSVIIVRSVVNPNVRSVQNVTPVIKINARNMRRNTVRNVVKF